MPRVIFFTTKQDLYFRLLIVDISNYNILYFFTNFLFLTWIVRIKYSKEEYCTNVVPKKKRRINGKIRNLIKKIDLTFWRQDELLLITSLVINPKKKRKEKKRIKIFGKRKETHRTIFFNRISSRFRDTDDFRPRRFVEHPGRRNARGGTCVISFKYSFFSFFFFTSHGFMALVSVRIPKKLSSFFAGVYSSKNVAQKNRCNKIVHTQQSVNVCVCVCARVSYSETMMSLCRGSLTVEDDRFFFFSFFSFLKH